MDGGRRGLREDVGRDRLRRAGTRPPKSYARWLTLAWRLAGQAADEFDPGEAQALADELVETGREVNGKGRVSYRRLRPYVEWAGGEVLADALNAAERERAHAQAEGMF